MKLWWDTHEEKDERMMRLATKMLAEKLKKEEKLKDHEVKWSGKGAVSVDDYDIACVKANDGGTSIQCHSLTRYLDKIKIENFATWLPDFVQKFDIPMN